MKETDGEEGSIYMLPYLPGRFGCLRVIRAVIWPVRVTSSSYVSPYPKRKVVSLMTLFQLSSCIKSPRTVQAEYFDGLKRLHRNIIRAELVEVHWDIQPSHCR